MIAVDTNLLVYAHRPDFAWHAGAVACLQGLAEHSATWAIPWHCCIEFVATVTHPRKFREPSSMAVALDQVAAWSESPSLRILVDSPRAQQVWRDLVAAADSAGPLVHDARIAAICLAEGVTELWSADRDYARFPQLKTRNPLR